MAGHHHFDPHSYENYGWSTPVSELPIYKGSIKRPLKPSANWRRIGVKPDGFTDVASEARAVHNYNVMWRSLDLWNFKSAYSGYLRKIFAKFFVFSSVLYISATWGKFGRVRDFSGYERNGNRSGVATGMGLLRPEREATNTWLKDVRFSERLGKQNVDTLNKRGVDLQ